MHQNTAVREFRSLKVRELRAEKTDEGKQFLSGYAANYNVLSDDLGWGLRERIMPGAFARALSEGQDVRHLINHDPNLVLGRTKAGTTELSEDSKGLKFRTQLPETTYAKDLYASVDRGDIDECSFGFVAVRTAWIEEPDPEDAERIRSIRELHDVDLFDISTVTYPAYPGTNTAAERSTAERALWPDGVPVEVRSRMQLRDAAAGDCMCKCPECLDGDCQDCSNADCTDENCRCEANRSSRRADAKTKRVDGEDLTADCFLIVGDAEDTGTWKLPWKFSTDEKTKKHLKSALARINQVKGVAEGEKKTAWDGLVKLCKAHDIEVSEENSLRSHLTPQQLYDFERESILEKAAITLRAIEASL